MILEFHIRTWRSAILFLVACGNGLKDWGQVLKYIYQAFLFILHISGGSQISPQFTPRGWIVLNGCWCGNTYIYKIISVITFLAQSFSHISMSYLEYRTKHLLIYKIISWVMNIIANVNTLENGKEVMKVLSGWNQIIANQTSVLLQTISWGLLLAERGSMWLVHSDVGGVNVLFLPQSFRR